MKYLDIINEGRDAPLYHGTGLHKALLIMSKNEIMAVTPQSSMALSNRKDPTGVELFDVLGVSLSRNKNMSMEFGDVVFSIDQRKLSYTNKIVPFDYWSSENNLVKPSKRHLPTVKHSMVRYEFEEFCIGPIKNLDKLLLSILMKKDRFEYYKKAFEEGYLDMDISRIANHPLLKII